MHDKKSFRRLAVAACGGDGEPEAGF